MPKSLKILFIEDDIIEVMKFNRVVSDLDLNLKIKEANNGEEALSILDKREFVPDIIISDLNMPKVNGLEFLAAIKKDDFLRYIPTIILTTSSNHKDVSEAYKIGIAGYILKPLKYEEYVQKMKHLLAYWSVNELISQ